MGTDKAFLEIAGQTLLERAVQVVRNVCDPDSVILVSGRQAQTMSSVESVPDRVPQLGPLGGIASCVKYYRDRAREVDFIKRLFLVLPIDMPVIKPATLTKLFLEIGSADAIHFDGRALPLVFRPTEKVLNFLENELPKLEPKKRSLREFETFITAKTISEAGSTEDFRNVNTPEEWQKFLQSEKDGSTK